MTWFKRIFGSFTPKADSGRMEAIRQTVGSTGDEPGPLEALLSPSVDLNTHDSRPVFPIVLAGMGVMITNHGTLPLILAAMLHKPERTRILLNHGASISVACAHGRTPLHWAILGEPDSSLLNTYEVLCKEAIAAEESLSPIGQIGPLEQAASLATTRVLLEHGADPNVADALGQTPLHRACSVGGKTEHLRLLLGKGAKVDAETPSGDTPLMLATQVGLEEAVAMLLEAGADPNRANGIKVTPLHQACARKFVAVARKLLSAHADPGARDDKGVTPLAIAVDVGEADLVRALLVAGAAQTPASGFDQANRAGVQPPEGFVRSGSLVVAAAQGDLHTVRELLRRSQAELESRTDDGWTALHEAVAHGPEMTRVLLEAGANANASSDAGYTPLHRAASKGLPDVVKLLVEYGADVSATDAGGNTLMRFAQSSRDRATIALVTDLCSDVDQFPAGTGSADQLSDYLSKSLDKAPHRIRLARAQGRRLISGGDGGSPDRAVVVHAPEIGWGVTLIYEYLDEHFGRRWINRPENDGSLFERGWRFLRVDVETGGTRQLNCMEIGMPNGQERKVYFDVTEWCHGDSVLLLLMAHARMNSPDSPPVDVAPT